MICRVEREIFVATKQIDDTRIKLLNVTDPGSGKYTLYWMEQSQRTELNHALEFAVQRANENNDRLLVIFALSDDYPGANLRHYRLIEPRGNRISSDL
jgi:deoxyribodipyrimidine photo-lyase